MKMCNIFLKFQGKTHLIALEDTTTVTTYVHHFFPNSSNLKPLKLIM
jgi:hypothetical protein